MGLLFQSYKKYQSVDYHKEEKKSIIEIFLPYSWYRSITVYYGKSIDYHHKHNYNKIV